MVAVSLITKMHTVKILLLDTIGPNLDSVVNFLKCFPCLEKLYVILHLEKDINNVREHDPLDPIECLELNLKKVVLKNYDGIKRAIINFAKFFILNAKVLEEMEIGVLGHGNDKRM
uniref:FBD domain-containing protein n=2 Tax=Triticum TaxID=4564 RepID=A0A8R7K4K5_TRIUA